MFNAPFSNTRSVAELVIGELLLLLRGVPEANAKAHRGVWNKLAVGSFEARGKKLGIIGYGHIGTQLGILAESLGMHVFFYDIENKLPLGNATQVQHLSDLLNMSDVVSLHVPENASTKNMMGAEELALMKPGALLINASRGTVVDIPALCDALASKHLAGAAIDVFPTEPATNSDPFTSPLCEFDSVILTPLSAVRPRKRRRTSVWKWLASWRSTLTTGQPCRQLTSRKFLYRCTAAVVCCISMRTGRAS